MYFILVANKNTVLQTISKNVLSVAMVTCNSGFIAFSYHARLSICQVVLYYSVSNTM